MTVVLFVLLLVFVFVHAEVSLQVLQGQLKNAKDLLAIREFEYQLHWTMYTHAMNVANAPNLTNKQKQEALNNVSLLRAVFEKAEDARDAQRAFVDSLQQMVDAASVTTTKATPKPVTASQMMSKMSSSGATVGSSPTASPTSGTSNSATPTATPAAATDATVAPTVTTNCAPLTCDFGISNPNVNCRTPLANDATRNCPSCTDAVCTVEFLFTFTTTNVVRFRTNFELPRDFTQSYSGEMPVTAKYTTEWQLAYARVDKHYTDQAQWFLMQIMETGASNVKSISIFDINGPTTGGGTMPAAGNSTQPVDTKGGVTSEAVIGIAVGAVVVLLVVAVGIFVVVRKNHDRKGADATTNTTAAAAAATTSSLSTNDNNNEPVEVPFGASKSRRSSSRRSRRSKRSSGRQQQQPPLAASDINAAPPPKPSRQSESSRRRRAARSTAAVADVVANNGTQNYESMQMQRGGTAQYDRVPPAQTYGPAATANV